jgi:hypothetical protein
LIVCWPQAGAASIPNSAAEAKSLVFMAEVSLQNLKKHVPRHVTRAGFGCCTSKRKFGGGTNSFRSDVIVAVVRLRQHQSIVIPAHGLPLVPSGRRPAAMLARNIGVNGAPAHARPGHRARSGAPAGNRPAVEVIGVYRLEVAEELFREQLSILYPDPLATGEQRAAEDQIRHQLASVVLIEARVHNRDERFDVSHFTQAKPPLARDQWQAAWAEAYLSRDGVSLAADRWTSAPPPGDLRVAFFLHYWEPDSPLRTSYGEVLCPPPCPMPARLKRLVPFEPVD